MLSALGNGVKGGRWYALVDKVFAPNTLAAAWTKVRANKGVAGVDGQSIERFAARAEEYLAELSRALREGSYRPQAVKRVDIPKGDGRTRPLGIPTVKDRILQQAVRLVIEPMRPRRADQKARHDRLLMHVQTTAPLDDRLHHRLLPSEGDRDAAGTFETLLCVLPVPGGDKEWYLYAARAGLPSFLSLSTIARCEGSDKSARAATISTDNGAPQALVAPELPELAANDRGPLNKLGPGRLDRERRRIGSISTEFDIRAKMPLAGHLSST